MPAPTNEQLLAKAINAANSLAAAGKLNPAQAERFLDFVFDETMLTKMARVIRFRNEQLDIDKIGIGRRAAVPASEGVDPGTRRGVNHSKVTLTPVEVMVPIEITETYKEWNLEGASVVDKILRMFAKQLANDWEDLSTHGDTAGPLVEEDFLRDGGSTTDVVLDAYMALFDGWLKLAENGNVVDIEGAALSGTVFRKMLNAMPSKFKRIKSELRWICSHETEELWRERMSTRATAGGDLAMSSQASMTPFGIAMLPVPLFEHHPKRVQTSQFSGAGATIQLGHKPILAGSVQIIDDADVSSKLPTTPYLETTDFTVDEATGIITHVGAGSIPTTTDLRITYRSGPSIILTHVKNFIVGIGRDVTIEQARDIYRRADQYAIHVKFDAKIEEDTALVLAENISDTL